MSFDLYKFQKIAVKLLIDNYKNEKKGSLLNMQTGMGKTIVILDFLSNTLNLSKKEQLFFIIVPKSIKFQWKRENESKYPNVKINLLHYEQFIKFNFKPFTSPDNELILIIDEAHNVKNEASQLFQKIDRISFFFRFIIMSTATPFLNEPKDIQNIAKFTDNIIISVDWPDVSDEIKLPQLEIIDVKVKLSEKHQTVYDLIASKCNSGNLIDISLLQRISNHQFFIFDQSSLEKTIFPLLTSTTISAKQKPKKRKRFSKTTQFLSIDSDDENIPLPVIQDTLTHKINGIDNGDVCNIIQEKLPNYDYNISIDDLNDSNKFKTALDLIVKNIDKTPIIIFSRYSQTLTLFGIYLTLNEIPFKQIDGTKTSKKKSKHVGTYIKSFIDKPVDKLVKKVLLCSQGVCGVGLNMTFSSVCIIFEKNWNSALDQQVYSRIYRLGQKKDCSVYILNSDTCAEKAIETCSQKKDLIKDALFSYLNDFLIREYIQP